MHSAFGAEHQQYKTLKPRQVQSPSPTVFFPPWLLQFHALLPTRFHAFLFNLKERKTEDASRYILHGMPQLYNTNAEVQIGRYGEESTLYLVSFFVVYVIRQPLGRAFRDNSSTFPKIVSCPLKRGKCYSFAQSILTVDALG